jgi:folate-binding protein YgfZ
MSGTYIPLPSRAVIALSGDDAKTFLQGIVTNDVTKLSPTQPLYALMLTPQGKFYFDMFVVEAGDGSILLDVDAERKDALMKRLAMYRLRSKVEIADAGALACYAIIGDAAAEQSAHGIVYADPRKKELGSRAMLLQSDGAKHLESLGLKESNIAAYNTQRILLGVPDNNDMDAEKSFPLQFRMDELGAIDFNKGCYVGQEVTARTKHRGTVRRLSYSVKADANLPAKGTSVSLNEKQIGELCSVSGNVAIAHLESEALEQAAGAVPSVNNTQLKIV